MTCHECRDAMLEVARDGAALAVESAVRSHVASCESCSRELERERAVTAGLRAVARQHADTTASSNLESRLLAAFGLQHEGERQPSAVPPLQGPSRAASWLSLAAMATLCAAGLVWWLTRPAPVSLHPPAIVKVQEQPVPPGEPVQVAQVAHSAPPAASNSSRAAHRLARRPVKPPIQAVGFVPIPSAAGLPEFESGQIVRLGIPVSALPNYGLEIPVGPESSIQADLLVGQDGQPRAIRLVNAMSQDPRPRH